MMLRDIRRELALLAIVVLMASACLAGDGLALMKVEHGARPAGMGAAFVSIVDDPNGAHYNPASIVGISQFTASFGHTAYWENVRLESAFFAINLSRRMFLHGGIRFAAVDQLEMRDLPTLEPISEFDAHDISFKTGMTYCLSEKVAVGLAMGWFVEKISSYRGSAFNVDFGVLVRPTENINIGASITNMGSDFNLQTAGVEGSRDISLPTTYSLGASYTYGRYLGAIDLVAMDGEAHAHIGVEAKAHEMIKFRTGVMANYDSKNFTAGASFTRRNLTVDYGFVPYTNNLGTSHVFNLTFSL